ncbi:uncharacterized protein J3D65DRAFT_637366 [Phyllosticta citribraziliensis]|uniref:Uncharacterized protein n=1 Tax=Phyllosticta citribraziliensis TaxID=989973 RepID=A0ABR1L7Y4_9PEZI
MKGTKMQKWDGRVQRQCGKRCLFLAPAELTSVSVIEYSGAGVGWGMGHVLCLSPVPGRAAWGPLGIFFGGSGWSSGYM